MKKKKLKKKYKQLQQLYDELLCNYMRLKEPGLFENMTDEQILEKRDATIRIAQKIADAFHKAFNN